MIIRHDTDRLSSEDGYCDLPALITSGCSCCSSLLPLTQENIALAIKEAEDWIKELKTLVPVSPDAYEKTKIRKKTLSRVR